MTTRPTISPLFATDGTFTSGAETGLSPRLDPGAGFRAQGFYPSRRVPARWANFLRGLLGDWVDYIDQKTRHDQNVLNFGADVSGAATSHTAFQNAHDAATAAGGRVLVPPGSYRFDDTVHVRPGVHWIGVPDRSIVNINHATKSIFAFDSGTGFYGTSHKAATLVYGLSFGALVANTGAAISNPSGTDNVRVKFQNCAWNDPDTITAPLNGRMLLAQGANSVFAFEDCYLRATGNASADALFLQGAELWVVRSRLIMPATYSSNLIAMDGGTLHAFDNYFDVTAHGGAQDIIALISTGWHVLDGNEFHGAFSSGACIKTFGAGVKIHETGSVFDTVNPYALGGALAQGSELSLAQPLSTAAGVGVTAVTCTTGYRGQSIKFVAGSPTITLPQVLFAGQTFDLTIYNLSGGSWAGAPSIANYGTKATVPAPIGNNQGVSARFVASDPKLTGTLEWHQIGDWALTAP